MKTRLFLVLLTFALLAQPAFAKEHAAKPAATAPATAAPAKAEESQSYGFCKGIGGFSAMVGKKNGLKLTDSLTMKSITPDCPNKKALFSISSATAPEKFESKSLNDLLCAGSADAPNMYAEAVKGGWDLDVHLTFAGGKEKSMKLCK